MAPSHGEANRRDSGVSSGPWIRWNLLEIEAILEAVSRTNKTLKQIMAELGYPPSHCLSFCGMLRRKSVWGEAYVRAKNAKVARMRAQLLGAPDELLLALGKRGLNKAVHAVNSARLVRERRADAVRFRAERKARDPAGESLREARRRATKNQEDVS